MLQDKFLFRETHTWGMPSEMCSNHKDTDLTKQGEPQLQKMYLCTCEPSLDSDQPAHLHSLIRMFSWHILASQGCSFFMWKTKTLIRLCRCTGWFESSLGTHVRRYVFAYCSSEYMYDAEHAKKALIYTNSGDPDQPAGCSLSLYSTES